MLMIIIIIGWLIDCELEVVGRGGVRVLFEEIYKDAFLQIKSCLLPKLEQIGPLAKTTRVSQEKEPRPIARKSSD
jgi:hypothetical protein